MPASVPPPPSLPGVAQTRPSTTELTVSDTFDVALPLNATLAVFDTGPAAVAIAVTVIGADVAPAASVPMLQLTGPVPAQPVCETNTVPAGIGSVMVTLVAATAP